MLSLAMLLAYVLRQSVPGLGHAGDLSENVAVGSWILLAAWLAAISLFGGYSARLLTSGPEIFRNVLHASLAAAGITGTAMYLMGIELSRAYFVVFFLVGPVLLLLNRYIGRLIINRSRTRGHFRQAVVAVGTLPHISGIASTLQRETWLGYEITGVIVPPGDATSCLDCPYPILGDETDLLELVRRERPAVLLFTAGSAASAEEFRRTAWQLEDLAIDVIVVPALTEVASDRVRMRPVAGLPLVHMDLPRATASLKWSKRLFDIVASAGLLLVLSPLLLVIALSVKLTDGGPIIFRQQRVGRGGEPFEFLKFRSMVTDAEERLKRMLAEGGQDRGNDVMFKMADDPRITPAGWFLRRYSLDELPQLWNVLRGDMSLVGPRPALPNEVDAYDDDARRRLTVRPGITGLWQVSGRSDLSWNETVRLDLYYVDNWSFTQDMQILLRTVRAVLAPSGAY
ncbi:sugar transferase [Brachybacterium sp. EF45031]|nr:sugar transferase [Brachybacterium sillae]